MRRFFSIFLCSLSLVSLLSGCGESFEMAPVTMDVDTTYACFRAHEDYIFKEVSVKENSNKEIIIFFKACPPKN